MDVCQPVCSVCALLFRVQFRAQTLGAAPNSSKATKWPKMSHKSLLVAPSAPPRGFVPEDVHDKHGNLVKKIDSKGRINPNWQRLVNAQKLKEEAAQLALCLACSWLIVCCSVCGSVVIVVQLGDAGRGGWAIMCWELWLTEVVQQVADAQGSKGTRRTLENICAGTFGGKANVAGEFSFDKKTGSSGSKYQCMLLYAQARCLHLCISVCVSCVCLCVCVGGLGCSYSLLSALCSGLL